METALYKDKIVIISIEKMYWKVIQRLKHQRHLVINQG
jgi:hypothetical protein